MPVLLLDKSKCLKNIEFMARVASDHQVSFRPHCKTHQSAEVAGWMRDYGVSKITVSSFRMASYFARNGWKDILVAFPFNPMDLTSLNQIAEVCSVSILLDNPETLSFLKKAGRDVNYYIDIDTGYGRTGVKSDDYHLIENIISSAGQNPHLNFSGFYCHAGHSYKARSEQQRLEIHQKAMADMADLKDKFRNHFPVALYGDTPSCSTMNNFKSIDEITPGNFVFYDLIQRFLGSCKTEQIAVAMECPIAGKYNRTKTLLVHGGAIHFSKEVVDTGGRSVYGEVVQTGKEGWSEYSPASYLTSLSQEHGILENCDQLFKRKGIGDTILILPPHSCLTANLMKEYRTLDGKVISTMNS